MYDSNFTVTASDYERLDLPEEWLHEVYRRKWFKLFIPKELGGLGCNLTKGLEIMLYTSSLHGSLGWCVNLGSGAGYFCSSFEKSIASKLLKDDKAVFAGSGKVGSAQKTDRGFLVSGVWDFCTGSAHATAFTVNAEDNGDLHSFVLSRSQVTILREWPMFGLKATSSFKIETTDAFVPEELVFGIGQIKSFEHYAITQIPFETFARCCMLACYIGISKCFTQHMKLDQVLNSSISQEAFELNQHLSNCQDQLYSVSNKIWESIKLKGTMSPDHSKKINELVSQSSAKIYEHVMSIYYKAGTRLGDENLLSHHAFKDVLVASQHPFLK